MSAQVDAQDEQGTRCEPAYSLIQKMGGYSQVAEYIRRYGVTQARATNRSTVYAWTRRPGPDGTGGTGGYIPAKHWPALIRAARDHHGLVLSVADFSSNLAQALSAAPEGEA